MLEAIISDASILIHDIFILASCIGALPTLTLDLFGIFSAAARIHKDDLFAPKRSISISKSPSYILGISGYVHRVYHYWTFIGVVELGIVYVVKSKRE